MKGLAGLRSQEKSYMDDREKIRIICDGLARLGPGSTHRRLQAIYRDELETRGFQCHAEHWIERIENGRCGRIDLHAEGHDMVLAIEIDNRTPSSWSIMKLRAAKAFRIIALRHRYAKVPDPIRGIDHIFACEHS